MNAKPQPGLAHRVARSVMTIVGGRMVIRLIGFINTLLVARLLTPDDFGLIAIGIVLVQMLENISEVGVSRTVVKFRDADQGMFDTLFTLSVLKGLLVFAVMAVLAPFAAGFYEDPRVTSVMIVLGAIAFLKALRNPKFFEFERDLDFSKELMTGIGAKILAVAVSIAIAVTYRSHWAIILGLGAGTLFEVVLTYVFRPNMPKLSFSAFGQLIGFTGWISATGALIAINNKIAPLIMGRILGSTATGVYYVGSQLAGHVGRELTMPLVKALYPGLSSLQGQPERMRLAYLRGAEAMAAIVAPAAFGLSFVAEDITAVVLGERWTDAALVVQILTPVFGLMAVVSGMQSLAMAAGKVRPLFFREFYFLIAKFPILIFGMMQYGLLGAVWGVVISNFIYIALQSRLYAITTGDAWWRPFWVSRRGLLALVPMTIWFLLIRPIVAGIEDLPQLVRLMTDCATGAVLYAAALLVLWIIEGFPDGFEKQSLQFLRKRGRA